jgi:hypothetical protein
MKTSVRSNRCIAAVLISFLPLLALAEGDDDIKVVPAVKSDQIASLRNLPVSYTGDTLVSPAADPGGYLKGSATPVVDRAAQTGAVIAPAAAATPGLGFDGVGNGFTGPQGTFTVQSAPPDTVGAIGRTQYVQWVNSSFAVFDKNTGAVVYGPVAGNTLFAGFGGVCQTQNDGDPIVQYDKAADRWIMTQFAVPANGPFMQCIAVSKTSDATGGYNRYAFQYSGFNDYPKLGIWPDAYYITYNMFNAAGTAFLGAQVCAFNRAAMLAGTAATQQCKQLSTAYGGLMPADLDGSTPPPAGSPNFILSGGTNNLYMWKFHVDWTTPANTTFTGPVSIPVTAFNTACGGGTCIPQPSTTQKLDSLADRLMYRLAYRNFGDHEALVVSHAVTVGTTASGVRWYEIRNPNGTPSVFQQSSYSPDTASRWMSSIAMDKAGNIAVGYNVSSSTIKPSLRYSTRVATDPVNTLSNETSIVVGGGSQLATLSRWGDYTAMTIDPIDDCTFWYTGQYLKANGTFNWSTRISSFKMPNCGGVTPLSATNPASQSVTAGATATFSVTASGGTTPYSYKWFKNGVQVAGATTSTYSIVTTTSDNGALIHAQVTDSAVTPATVTTADATLTVTAPPPLAIATQPASVTVTVGATASFSVVASGGKTPYIYTWFKNGVQVSTGNVASYSFVTVAADNGALIKVTVTDSATPQASVTSSNATLTVTAVTQQELMVNGTFETATTPWAGTTGDIGSFTGEPAYAGTRNAWMGGNGSAITETLGQTVAIPSAITKATLSFFLHIDTAETTTATAYDTLSVQVRNTAGTVLQTLVTYSNLNKATGYQQRTFDLTAFKGQTVQIFFNEKEDSSLQTSFVLDNVSLIVQ